jgi:hypothetical protein
VTSSLGFNDDGTAKLSAGLFALVQVARPLRLLCTSTPNTGVGHRVFLGEEEISDVSLAMAARNVSYDGEHKLAERLQLLPLWGLQGCRGTT